MSRPPASHALWRVRRCCCKCAAGSELPQHLFPSRILIILHLSTLQGANGVIMQSWEQRLLGRSANTACPHPPRLSPGCGVPLPCLAPTKWIHRGGCEGQGTAGGGVCRVQTLTPWQQNSRAPHLLHSRLLWVGAENPAMPNLSWVNPDLKAGS